MATINRKGAQPAGFGGAAYGQMSTRQYSLTVGALGKLNSADWASTAAASAIASGDTVNLGIIPKGTKLIDATLIVSDAVTALTSAMVGFAYVDGVDDTSFPQDADYFFGNTALGATGVTRKTSLTRPGVLQKDAYLTMLPNVTIVDAGQVDVLIYGEEVGVS